MFPVGLHHAIEMPPSSDHHNSRIIIDDRYLLKRLIHKYPFFNVYEGIDFKACKYAMVYIKPVLT
jgi:hypothetical protein